MTKATYMRTKILNMKDIKKSKLIISDDIFNYFEERFVEGALSIDEISKLLDCKKYFKKV